MHRGGGKKNPGCEYQPGLNGFLVTEGNHQGNHFLTFGSGCPLSRYKRRDGSATILLFSGELLVIFAGSYSTFVEAAIEGKDIADDPAAEKADCATTGLLTDVIGKVLRGERIIEMHRLDIGKADLTG